jgi:peroxiredoxin
MRFAKGSYGVAFLMVAVLVAAAWSRADVESMKGKAAPDFTLSTLDGKSVTLSEQKGKVVLLDFWATWCPPCVKALPHVQKLSEDKARADKGLVVWAVNVGEGKGKIEPFMNKHGFNFGVPMDQKSTAMKSYGIEGIPTQIVVGKDGKVAYVSVGYAGAEGEAALDAAIDAALAAE